MPTTRRQASIQEAHENEKKVDMTAQEEAGKEFKPQTGKYEDSQSFQNG